MSMNKWDKVGWPSSVSLDDLNNIKKSFSQSWFECDDACKDYHSFFWFFISLHLVDKDHFMTPGYVLDILESEITTRIESLHQLEVLLIGSASEQSAALVCNKLEKWRPNNWKLTIVDRCQTPLNRISSIADPSVQAVCDDLSNLYTAGSGYDLIIGDCVLEFNSPENRRKMLENVSTLLSVDGTFVQRERTGDVAEAFNISRECEYVVQKAKILLDKNDIPPDKKHLSLIRSKTLRFLLQILDTHNAYETVDSLENDISDHFQILHKQYQDKVSKELIYRYYLMGNNN